MLDFHMSFDGFFSGFLCPSGFRIFGLKSSSAVEGQFFIECRNFQVRQFGMLSAIIPSKPIPGQHLCQLALTNGVRYASNLHAYVFNFHLWKKTSRYDTFLSEPHLLSAIKNAFRIGLETESSNINLVYLNAILTFTGIHQSISSQLFPSEEGSLGPVQCSLDGPDVWFDRNICGDSF